MLVFMVSALNELRRGLGAPVLYICAFLNKINLIYLQLEVKAIGGKLAVRHRRTTTDRQTSTSTSVSTSFSVNTRQDSVDTGVHPIALTQLRRTGTGDART